MLELIASVIFIIVVVAVFLYYRKTLLDGNIFKTEHEGGGTFYRVTYKNKPIHGIITIWNKDDVLLGLGVIGPNGERTVPPIEGRIVDISVGTYVSGIIVYVDDKYNAIGVQIKGINEVESEIVGKKSEQKYISTGGTPGTRTSIRYTVKDGIFKSML
jgi:hypothetical protein